MGKAITDKNSQLSYLQNRLKMFVEVIDHLDPEHAEVDDIDRLIQLLDDMEVKVKQFNNDHEDAE